MVTVERNNQLHVNYTYLTKGIKNDSADFWINMSVGNLTAHDIVYYEWWTNTSAGIENSTGNYSFTVVNQAPNQISVTAPNDHASFENKTAHFSYTATDNDAEDSLIMYLYINGTYNASTTSTTSLEATGFEIGSYEYVFFAYDGYGNGTNSTTRYFNIVGVTYPQFSSHDRT
jgi:hypothetical protein